MSLTPADRADARRWARRFALTSLVIAAAVVGVGWATGIKAAASNVLMGVAVFAFWPFVFLGLALALACLVVVLAVLAAALGSDVPPETDGLIGVVEAGAGLSESTAHLYYGLLSRVRHPVAWGVPMGFLCGGLLLGAFVAAVVWPGETRTAVALAHAQDLVEAAYDKDKSYPDPAGPGHLTHEAIAARGVPVSGAGPVLDGFGRPLRYEVTGSGRSAAYSIRSDGYDTASAKDDLEVRGETTLHALRTGPVALLASKIKDKTGVTVKMKLQVVRDMRRKR